MDAPMSVQRGSCLIVRMSPSRNGTSVFGSPFIAADAHYNLADAYLKNGQKDLARQYAEKALAMIDSHKAPLSSWSDTEQRRAEIRGGVQDTLKELNAAH